MRATRAETSNINWIFLARRPLCTRDNEGASGASRPPGGAHESAKRRRHIWRLEYVFGRDQPEFPLRRVRMMDGPLLVMHRYFRKVGLSHAEFVHVATGELC